MMHVIVVNLSLKIFCCMRVKFDTSKRSLVINVNSINVDVIFDSTER